MKDERKEEESTVQMKDGNEEGGVIKKRKTWNCMWVRVKEKR